MDDVDIKHLCNMIDRYIRYRILKFKYLREFLMTNNFRRALSYGIFGLREVNECFVNSIIVIYKWLLNVIYKKTVSSPNGTLYKETQISYMPTLFFKNYYYQFSRAKLN